MPKVAIYNLAGDKTGDLELSEAVFGVPMNDDLVHQAFVARSANQRTVIAHTKDRAERAGSGKKPFKQKGTGSARSGQKRSPLWRKGGVVFGPRKDRNFTKDINKKMNRKAILMALSDKVRKDNLIVLESIVSKDKKTRESATALKALKVKGKVLVGFGENEQEYRRCWNNLAGAETTLVSQFNVLDMLNNRKLVCSADSIKYLEEKYGKKSAK